MLYEILTGNPLYGFSEPKSAEEFKGTIQDSYIANKMLRSIKNLLSSDLDALVSYWAKFPSELEHVLSPPFESQDIDESTAKKLRDIYLNKSKKLDATSSKSPIHPDDIKDEVLTFIKKCGALSFLDNLMTEFGE